MNQSESSVNRLSNLRVSSAILTLASVPIFSSLARSGLKSWLLVSRGTLNSDSQQSYNSAWIAGSVSDCTCKTLNRRFEIKLIFRSGTNKVRSATIKLWISYSTVSLCAGLVPKSRIKGCKELSRNLVASDYLYCDCSSNASSDW